MRKLLICLLACFALSCEKGDQDIIKMKIVNDTHLQLENFTVGEVMYGNVAPGAHTEYKIIPNSSAMRGCEFTWTSEEALQRIPTFIRCGNDFLEGFPPGNYVIRVQITENFITAYWRSE